MSRVCENCGNDLSTDAKFCTVCGVSTTQINVPQPVYPHQENDQTINIQKPIIRPTYTQPTNTQPTTMQPIYTQPTTMQQSYTQPTTMQSAYSQPIYAQPVGQAYDPTMVQRVSCNHCRFPNLAHKNFCVQCGKPLTQEAKKINSKRKVMKFATYVAAFMVVVLFVNYMLLPKVNQRFGLTLGFDQSRFVQKQNGLSSTGTEIIPKQGKLIVEGLVNEENPALEDIETGIKIVLSPLSIEKEVKASIKKVEVVSPLKSISITAYDFELDVEKPIEGVITLELPYDKETLPEGYSATECLVGLYYNEETNQWENPHYRIDEEREKVIITTYHLSTYGIGKNMDPSGPVMKDGTIDLSGNQVFTNNDTWSNKSNYNLFFTHNEWELDEVAYDYDFDLVKSRYETLNNDLIMQKIASVGFDNATQVNVDTTLSFLGKGESYPEHFTTVVIEKAYTSEKLKAFNSGLSNLGGALTLFQLASDIYYGKSTSQAGFAFLKGMVYWRGAWAAEMVAGTVAGSYVALALVGLFVIEQFLGPLESWNDNQFAKLPEHKKLFGAYNTYYRTPKEVGGGARNEHDWSVIIDELNKKALESTEVPEGMERDAYFQQLLKTEIEAYTNLFWELPLETRAEKVILNRDGFLYGKWSLVYYAGSPDDKPISIYVYVDNIRADKVPGMTLSAADAYLIKAEASPTQTIEYKDNFSMAQKYMSFFDGNDSNYTVIKDEMKKKLFNDVLNKKIIPMMTTKKEEYFLKREAELKAKMQLYQTELNKPITLNFVDDSVETMEKAKYAGYILVPKSTVLKDKGLLEKWYTVLNKDGLGTLTFTTLAHQRAGYFTQFDLYKPEDIKKINEVTPVKTVDVAISADTNEVKIGIIDDYVGTYYGTLPIKESMKQYYDMMKATGTSEDQEITITIDKDDKVNVKFKIHIDMKYDLMGAKFATDSITVVDLNGVYQQNGSIKIVGKGKATSNSTVEGPMYEEGGGATSQTSELDYTINLTLVKTEDISKYKLVGTIKQSAEGTSMEIKVDAIKQVTFD